ncbi:hypothetical protein [Archangium violaceum]|uniref:hypothetical protein n=1 Tax=Archangium violaceum TaxID=83451 RepID=UPI0036DC0396
MAEAGEQATGTKDENYDVISVLYHCLKGASDIGQYIQDAEQSGDQELVDFFRDYQESQKDLAERAKNLLGARLARTEGVKRGADTGISSKAAEAKDTKVRRSAGAQTNARVKSGGNASDDIVDEESKESFPASDSPARY